MCKTIDVNNAAEYYLAGYYLPADTLRAVSMKFITENFAAVKETPGMKNMQHEAMMEILEFASSKLRLR